MIGWFHGTDALLDPGDWVEPGAVTGRVNFTSEASRGVWVCDDPVWAALWAGAVVEMRGETGPGFVYEVEPALPPVRVPGDPGDGPQFVTPRARVVARVGLGTPGTPTALHDAGTAEGWAWCSVAALDGTVLRTNAYEDSPEGSSFLTVLAADGTQLGWWPAESWGDPSRASEVMALVWATAAAGVVLWDDDFDAEYVVALAHGSVRACPSGSYVRLVDADGAGVDDGSAYWVVDEWVEDPVGVMGAILGGAAALA